MGLYKRGKIFWFNISQDGKRIQISTKTENKRLAEKIYAKALSDVVEGRFFEKQKAKSTTFEQLADKYMASYQKQRDPYSLKHLLPFFGSLSLAEITTEAVEEYIDTRKGEGSALGTIQREFTLGRRMFNVARRKWKLVKENPFADVQFPKFDDKRDRWLSLEEEQRLIDSANQEWLKDIIIFAINTGCRRGEILSLTWKDHIDMARRCISIQATKGGSKKIIPMSEVLYSILVRRSRVSHISGRVFPVKVFALKSAFERAVRRAGIEDLHFHDLRHTFATRLVQGGSDLYAVQKLLGHRSSHMTERYAHHQPDSLRPVIGILDNCYKSATHGQMRGKI